MSARARRGLCLLATLAAMAAVTHPAGPLAGHTGQSSDGWQWRWVLRSAIIGTDYTRAFAFSFLG